MLDFIVRSFLVLNVLVELEF